MNDKLRQSIISLIWPGPIAGPLPINLFRVLAIFSVVLFGPIIATFLMAIITTVFLIWYFELLELTGGKRTLENLLSRLPALLRGGVISKGPVVLFFSGLFIGVFPYTIFLKLLKYPKIKSEILLSVSAILSSFFWTGIIWGSVVEVIKRLPAFAF